MVKLNRFRILLVLTCAYAVFLFYLSSLSSPPDPTQSRFLDMLLHFFEERDLEFLVYPFYPFYRYPDKAAHIVLYMNFGVLINFTLRASDNSGLKKRAELFSLTIGAFYGVVDELNQLFVPYRSPSIMDFMADVLGLLIAQVLVIGLLTLKKFYAGK